MFFAEEAADSYNTKIMVAFRSDEPAVNSSVLLFFYVGKPLERVII